MTRGLLQSLRRRATSSTRELPVGLVSLAQHLLDAPIGSMPPRTVHILIDLGAAMWTIAPFLPE
jgi:hypothetical protein